MSQLQERLAQLSPAKQQLLELYLQRQNGSRPSSIIPHREGLETAPLSFAQQRFGFLASLNRITPVTIHLMF